MCCCGDILRSGSVNDINKTQMKTRFHIFLSMAIMTLMQTGCIFENDSLTQCPEDTESLVINLNLSVPSSSVATRGADDKLVAGTDDEGYIDIVGEDYQILIFDKTGTLVEGKLSEIECISNGNKNGKISYTLTAHLTLDGDEDRARLSIFRMMVLTNWKSFERSNTDPSFEYRSFTGFNVSGTGSDNIFRNGTDFNFTLGEQSDNVSWVPSAGKNQGIPMFGITEELSLQYVMDMGRYGDDPCFSVPMLRAMAKIEIVDMVPDGQSANIEKCVLTKHNTSGRFIPDIYDNADWNDVYTQILSPSLPDGVESVSTELLFAKTEKTVRTVGAGADETKECFVVYVPEMEIDPAQRPSIQVKLEGSEQIYPIELSGYEEGKPKPGTEYTCLLRNHSYRFDVLSVGSTEFDFIIQTPWQEEDGGEWEYEDLKIEFAQGKEFRWDFSNYDEETRLPKFEGGGVLESPRTVIITQDDWLEGRFTLTSPAKSRWTISLYGDDNTLNDHFNVEVGHLEQHDSDDGTYETKVWTPGGSSVSGNVGEDVLFRIIPSAVNNSNDHYVARVVLTCTTFDDRLIEINLPYYNNKGYEVQGSVMEMPTLDNDGYYYVKQYYSGFKDLDDDERERPGGMDGGSGEDDGQ